MKIKCENLSEVMFQNCNNCTDPDFDFTTASLIKLKYQNIIEISVGCAIGKGLSLILFKI